MRGYYPILGSLLTLYDMKALFSILLCIALFVGCNSKSSQPVNQAWDQEFEEVQNTIFEELQRGEIEIGLGDYIVWEYEVDVHPAQPAEKHAIIIWSDYHAGHVQIERLY